MICQCVSTVPLLLTVSLTVPLLFTVPLVDMMWWRRVWWR